ncbi:MAG: hypothetical protein WCW93_02545, partial [Candidatus Paceibacterota bacterium]
YCHYGNYYCAGTNDCHDTYFLPPGGSCAGGGKSVGNAYVCATTEDTLYGGKTTASCTSTGGTVVSDGINSLCQFAAVSCPNGWTPYNNYSTNNYSTTTAKTCVGTNGTYLFGSCTGAVSCTTGSHLFGNTATETCSYKNRIGAGLFCYDSSQTCTANVIEVGCY